MGRNSIPRLEYLGKTNRHGGRLNGIQVSDNPISSMSKNPTAASSASGQGLASKWTRLSNLQKGWLIGGITFSLFLSGSTCACCGGLVLIGIINDDSSNHRTVPDEVNNSTLDLRNDDSSSNFATDSEMERIFAALVQEVEVGMTTDQIRTLLGKPHEVNEHNVLGKQVVIWTWKSQKDPDNNFIHLDVSGGTVKGGGSPGYDVRTGFKMKLPSHNLGGADERERLKETLEGLGVEVEN